MVALQERSPAAVVEVVVALALMLREQRAETAAPELHHQ
jgi:hypothetical protein